MQNVGESFNSLSLGGLHIILKTFVKEMFKEMKKNGLQFLTLIALLTCIGLTTSFIFKRCSKLQIEQSCKGTMKCNKPLRYIL